MAYQLQEINRRIQTDVETFLAECDENYAQRVSLAADPLCCCPVPRAQARPPRP